MSDLCTRPLRASVHELLQEDSVDIAEALFADGYCPVALSNLAGICVATQRVVFEADALMYSLLAKAIWEGD